jgi:hypothetical protein
VLTDFVIIAFISICLQNIVFKCICGAMCVNDIDNNFDELLYYFAIIIDLMFVLYHYFCIEKQFQRAIIVHIYIMQITAIECFVHFMQQMSVEQIKLMFIFVVISEADHIGILWIMIDLFNII